MNPEKSNVITGLKSADSAHKIYRMIDIAKGIGCSNSQSCCFQWRAHLSYMSARTVTFPHGSFMNGDPHR